MMLLMGKHSRTESERWGFATARIAPRSPWQNPYVERLIGTLRRECLDHILIFGERHFHRVLTLYALYYTRHARIWDWPKTRRYDELSNDAEPSSPRQFCPDCMLGVEGVRGGDHHSYARI
jgi:hypothetical protein